MVPDVCVCVCPAEAPYIYAPLGHFFDRNSIANCCAAKVAKWVLVALPKMDDKKKIFQQKRGLMFFCPLFPSFRAFFFNNSFKRENWWVYIETKCSCWCVTGSWECVKWWIGGSSRLYTYSSYILLLYSLCKGLCPLMREKTTWLEWTIQQQL